MSEEQQDLFHEFMCKPAIMDGDTEKYSMIAVYRDGAWLLSVRTAEGRREFLASSLETCFRELHESGFTVTP
jgi:hypothetical protein